MEPIWRHWYFNSRPHGGRLIFGIRPPPTKYFNSRPHGGRHHALGGNGMVTNFNSRPHGGRLGYVMENDAGGNFNSRPHGGRLASPLIPAIWLLFQLTPSRRATQSAPRIRSPTFHFNSRPHGGRHIVFFVAHLIIVISTHALTEGDTLGQ